jgi:hypothetical protein
MGIAYLPDGSRMDYDKYISSHPHWQAVRKARFDFDNHACVICHKNLDNEKWETHHMNYNHLGNERMTDVVTMCCKHHTMFHNVWCKQRFWKGREPNHWETFSLEHTAKMCLVYYTEDRYISKNIENPNLCSLDVARQYIDRYFKEYTPTPNPVIDPNDFSLFVRNKRYEMFFDAEERGLTVEQFLNECFGEKVRGKNPLRQEAGRKNGPFDHEPKSFHRHYSENKNLMVLMQEVLRIKEETV